MNARRVIAIARKSLRGLRHDRRTAAFIVGMPLLLMMIFGYTFGGEVENLDVIVVDEDPGAVVPLPGPGNITLPLDLSQGGLSDQVIANIDPEKLVVRRMADLANARAKVRAGAAWAVLHFPPNYTRSMVASLVAPPGVTVEVDELAIYLDGSNPNVGAVIVRETAKAVQGAVTELFNGVGRPAPTQVLAPTVEYAYGSADLRFLDYFAPGVMAFAVLMATTMLTIIHFVQERSQGTLERLLASPATEGEIVAGSAMAFGILAAAQSAVVLVAGLLLFQIHVVGNLGLAFLVLILLALGHQGLGILLSSGARSEFQAVQFLPLIIFPSILLTGVFFPVQSIPEFLRPLASWVPLTYAISALRSVMVRGWGPAEIAGDLAVLVLFAILMLGGSVALLRRRR